MESADWIERRAAEYQERGHRRYDSYRMATADLYKLAVDEKQQRVSGDFDKFENRMKKARRKLRERDKMVQQVKAARLPTDGWWPGKTGKKRP